jgi:hypothetical protein
LPLLAHGGSSVAQTPNQTSSHMRRMVRVEVEVLASAVSLLLTSTAWFCFHGELDGRP